MGWSTNSANRRWCGHRQVVASAASIAALLAAGVLAATPAPAAPALPDDPTDRVEGNNPTIAQKLLGYDAWVRRAQRRPDVLVLGSSRAVMLDPAQVRRLTGRSTYNASISSGAARELLAVTSFADLRTAGELPRLVVMLDLEAFDNRRPTARVLDYQRRLDGAHRACPTLPRCRGAWMRSALGMSRHAAALQRRAPRNYRTTQRHDGRQVDGMLERLDAQGADLDALRRERIGIRVRSYRRGGFDRVHLAPRRAFVRMLQLANARGITPFVAITSMHPDCIRRCGAAGWHDRRAQVRALLDELARTYRFRLVDLSFPSTWGGSGADFYDEIHLRPIGAARVVRRLDRLGAFG